MSRVSPKQPANPVSSLAGTALLDEGADRFEDDPRWQLATRVGAGPYFARSPLMSKFLFYVVTETLAGRQSGITEHEIGVQVFRRPASYRTDEDNIVRNYARQLRKRLAEHFADAGINEDLRLTIPVGGYVPVFERAIECAEAADREVEPITSSPVDKDGQAFALSVEFHGGQKTISSEPQGATLSTQSFPFVLSPVGLFALVAYSMLLIAFTWITATRLHSSYTALEPAYPLWHELLSGSVNTYIVPPDAGLNIVEDIAHRNLPLAEYIKGSYLDVPLTGLDDHTQQDLRGQQFSDFLSQQIVALIARQSEYNPQRVLLRFPRDLRLDDLKTANAILIGSTNSNPWASIVDGATNFRIVPNADMRGALIRNSNPRPGESASYSSRWNEPSHETYAVIIYVPNLSGRGHILLIEGLDVAGTQAAAELLLHSEATTPIINQAKRPDGSLRPFEILLRTTSIQSNAAGTQIVASRIE